jgi:hypothetical protein
MSTGENAIANPAMSERIKIPPVGRDVRADHFFSCQMFLRGERNEPRAVPVRPLNRTTTTGFPTTPHQTTGALRKPMNLNGFLDTCGGVSRRRESGFCESFLLEYGFLFSCGRKRPAPADFHPGKICL